MGKITECEKNQLPSIKKFRYMQSVDITFTHMRLFYVVNHWFRHQRLPCYTLHESSMVTACGRGCY